MMHVAPFGWDVAGGEGAPAVAEGYGAAEWAGDGTVGPAEVQRLTLTAEDSRDDLRVTRHPPDGARGQMFPGVEDAGADLFGQLGVRHGQDQGGAFPALGGQVPDAQGPFGEF